jgi:hypothetical protein
MRIEIVPPDIPASFEFRVAVPPRHLAAHLARRLVLPQSFVDNAFDVVLVLEFDVSNPGCDGGWRRRSPQMRGSHQTLRWREMDSNHRPRRRHRHLRLICCSRELPRRGLFRLSSAEVLKRTQVYRRLRKRRVRARQREKRSRGTDLRAPGRHGPTPCAGNRRTHENSDCRAA